MKKRLAIFCMLVFTGSFLSSLAQDVEKKTVSLVTCEWAPFYGSDLERQGFITQIVRAAFENAGYQMNVEFIDWSTALKQAEDNVYDGLLGAYYSKEREENFLFSKPIYSAQNIFIARKEVGAKYDGDLKNLKGLRIGISKGYAYSDEFDHADFLTKTSASGADADGALVALILSNMVDVIAIQKETFLDVIQRNHSGKAEGLVALGPTLVDKKLFIAISKKNKNRDKIIQDFNDGLERLIKDGRYDKIILLLNQKK